MKILVISDIHGNAEALRTVLQKESDADYTLFLGDALLSGPQANETAQLLADSPPDLAIMGNHDHEVLHPEIFANWPAEWVALNEWLIESLDPGVPEMLATYQPAGRYQVCGLDMYLHHGDLPRATPALPDAEDETFGLLDDNSGCPLVLFGHTHVQFSRQVGDTTYINPGSVGQPRCGKLHACYGVFEDGVYSPRQVSYDPARWLEALERVTAMDAFPEFRQWTRDGLLSGFGIGEREPWTRFAAEGYC